MRDDERYPIPVQSYPDGEIPEVVPNTHPQDKFLVSNGTDGVPGVSAAKDDTAADQAPRSATICGVRRRTFWVVVAVVAVGVIAALVGGIVGGLKARESSGGDGDSGTGADSTSTGPPIPSPTGPLDPSDRAITAATNSGSNSSTLQIFYQDLDTTDILYRLVWEDEAKSEQRAKLTTPPIQGTPLAVTSSNRTDGRGLDVNLFYLALNNTNGITIVQAVLDCSNGAGTCSTASSQVISGAFKPGVNPASDLAAVLLDNEASKFRVYFQATGGLVWVFVGDDTSKEDWSAHQIGGPAPIGSSIAATFGGAQGSLTAAFVYNDTGLIRAVDYSDALGAQGGADVYSRSGSGFKTTSRFAACFVSDSKEYHIFYVGRTTRDIVGYLRSGVKGSWSPKQATVWGKADGDIATVAWRDQLRLLYMSSGKLAMNKQSDLVWSKVEYL